MELQGLQEALKVEIQCHQVNETWCYFSLVGVGASGEGGPRGDRGAPRPGTAEQGDAREARSRTSSTCSPMGWTLDGTLAHCGGFCGAAAGSRPGRELNIYEAGSERPPQLRRFVPLPTLQLGRLF